MKPVIILSIVLFLTGAVFAFNIRSLIYITIVFLFFPIYIPFMGRDAMTTGTVCIFFLYFKYLLESFKSRKFIREKFDLLVYLLLISISFSIILLIKTGTIGNDLVGPAIRYYVNTFSALLLFIVIKNYRNDEFESNIRSEFVEKILSLFLILVSLNILISISIKVFPSLGSVFTLFYPRDIEVLSFKKVGPHDIERIRSFVMTPERYGEFLAVLCPIALYKIFKYNKSIWIICLLLFCLGLIFSVTRSGIMLFILGMVLSFLYQPNISLGKTIIIVYILMMSILIIIFINPSFFRDIFLRFQDTVQIHEAGGTLYDTINRRVFLDAWTTVMSNLTIFGHGITKFHFHNLILTTLHKHGILGAILFFTTLFSPFVKLLKSYRIDITANKSLLFSCILSMILFFINELKFEFNRGDSYEQICWGLFATYYLASQINFNASPSKLS